MKEKKHEWNFAPKQGIRIRITLYRKKQNHELGSGMIERSH